MHGGMDEAVHALVLMIAPIMPHLAEDCGSTRWRLQRARSGLARLDPELAADEVVTLRCR